MDIPSCITILMSINQIIPTGMTTYTVTRTTMVTLSICISMPPTTAIMHDTYTLGVGKFPMGRS
jgi:hypothetical protein